MRGHSCLLKIRLPIAFTRYTIPVNKSHIPGPDTVKHWQHLQGIVKKLIPVSQCEAGLLKGYHCPRVLIPTKVISPTRDEPYAQMIDLG